MSDQKLEELERELSGKLQVAITNVLKDFVKPGSDVTADTVAECLGIALTAALKETFKTDQISQQTMDRVASPKAPANGRKLTRGYIDGCFDIMHSGHYNAVRQAKQLCDVLVVGIHTNEEIQKHKGPPVMNDDERRRTVEACKWADEIAWGTPYCPSIKLLDELKCDFCVHGDDTAVGANGEDAYAEMKKAGRMKIVKRTEGVSTTDLVGRLLLMTKQHHMTPSLAPLSATSSPLIRGKPGSPSLFATSADLLPPPLSLGAPSMEVPKPKSDVKTPAVAVQQVQMPQTMSNFLPTTWRISQFSNSRVPKPNDTVIYIDGAFDLFHIGHIETLQKARALGTFLYCGVHDDQTVNKHRGRNYPIMNLHERVLNVLSCKFVDEVVIGAPWIVSQDLITTLNITFVVSGTNTKLETETGPDNKEKVKTENTDPYEIPKKLNKYKEVETSRSLSTGEVVQRIIDNRVRYEERQKSRKPKEQAYLANQKQYIPEIGAKTAN